MKKRISQVLAIVLTIALLASTFVMLGMPTVSANEAVATEKLTIGDRTYTVLSEKKYDAYSGFAALVDGVDLETVLDFSESNWSFESKFASNHGWSEGPWGGAIGYKYTEPHDKKSVGLYGIQANHYIANASYAQSRYTSSITFDESGKLFVGPSLSFCASSENFAKEPAVKIVYTISETGSIVLYDTTGKFDATGTNLGPLPYYANEYDEAYTKVQIYKNDELLWPTNGDVIISKANWSVDFPDLGKLNVIEGDVISFHFYANPEAPTKRAGLFCNPGIAYLEQKPAIEEKTEAIKLGDETYYINANEKYNMADAMSEALSGYDVATSPKVTDAFDESVWEARISDFWTASPTEYQTNLYYIKGHSDGQGDYNALYTESSSAAWATLDYKHSIAFADSGLIFSPWCDSAYPNQYIDCFFHAPRDGKIVLYNNGGLIAPIGKNIANFNGWKDTSTNEVEITIYKNDVKIWPTDETTDNVLTSADDTVDISDLGEIELLEYDVLKIRFYEKSATGQRNAVKANFEVAYIDETPELEAIPMEDKIIGGQLFTVESSTISNAYDAFCGLVAGKSPIAYPADDSAFESAPIISFDNSAWRAVYKRSGRTYTDAAYTTSSGSSASAVSQLSFTKDKKWYDFVQGGIAFDPTYGMVINPGNTWAETRDMRVNYNVTADGKIALYDTDGKFITIPNIDPYWCWTDANAFVDVNVYKNDVLVWPLNGEDNRINLGEKFSFPVIELDVVKGDVISVSFSNNIAKASRTPVSVDLEVAYVHEHDENVVETAGTYYIPGKRNGTCTLCGNTYTDAPVINAEPAVTLDENSVKYDPATDKFSFKVYYSEGLMRDYDASVEQELGPTFTLKYKIGKKVKDVSLDPTEYIGHTIEFNGFNSSTLDETFTISFHMAWAGKDDGTGTPVSYVKKEDDSWLWSDEYEVFTFVPSDYIASEDDALVESFNTLKNKIAAAESEAAKVVAGCPSNSDYRINKAEVNIKEGKAIVSVAVTDELKNKVKANTSAGYDAAGRTAKYVLTIGGLDYDVPMDKLYTSTTFTISGLSYSQMFGQISAKIVVTYTDTNAQPIESTAISCDFATAIDAASDNTVASALASYMNSK